MWSAGSLALVPTFLGMKQGYVPPFEMRWVRLGSHQFKTVWLGVAPCPSLVLCCAAHICVFVGSLPEAWEPGELLFLVLWSAAFHVPAAAPGPAGWPVCMCGRVVRCVQPSPNCFLLLLTVSALGQSINPKLAGLVGRHGPQNKQPFMVAFFKATEVHLRSIRSTGGKQRSQNRSKPPKNQEALRVTNVAGMTQRPVTPGGGGLGNLCRGSPELLPLLLRAHHLHSVETARSFETQGANPRSCVGHTM